MSVCGTSAFLVGGVMAALLPAMSFAEVPAPPGEVGIPYQIEASRSCGALLSGCSVEFPVTPAKRRVDLKWVNCGVQGTGDMESVGLFLEPNSLISHELIEAQAIPMGGGETRHLYDQPTAMSVAAGRKVTVNVAASGGAVGMRCSLFGTLVFLP